MNEERCQWFLDNLGTLDAQERCWLAANLLNTEDWSGPDWTAFLLELRTDVEKAMLNAVKERNRTL